MEVLVHVENATRVKEAVVAAGGRLIHALTAKLLVISIPDSVSVSSIQGATMAEPEQLEGIERALAEAWISRFGSSSRTTERLAQRAAPAIPWDTPGYTPPNHLPGRPGSAPLSADPGTRSTNTPTSTVLTGSVAVGLVMVSGPPDPPTWMPVHGALKYVSVGADGTVWGVNAGDQIFRWNGSAWDRISGQLKQVSVGNASMVWGVNSADKIYRWNGTAWNQISGALKHVAVAGDGTVWGVNRNDEIFRWNGSAWDRISGRLKQISVGNAATVWGVNADDEIYQWNGNGWTRVAGALKHVSVAADGTVFGVNADDKIFSRSSTSWVQLPGRLKQISVSSSSLVWGVNSNDQIYFRQPGLQLTFSATEKALIMSEVLEGLTFLATADPEANVSFVQDWKDVSVNVAPGAGDDYEDFEAPWRNAALAALGFSASRSGSVAFANSLRATHQTDWSYVAYFTKYPLHHFAYASNERLVMDYNNDNWGPAEINRVFAHESCHIFGAADEYGDCDCDGSGHFDVPNNNCRNCTSAQVPCLMNANTLALCPWSRGQLGWSSWERIAGALKHASVGNDGTVWGVNAGDDIFRRNGNAWERVSGALKQISVGNAANVWGVNRNDNIFRWNGSSWTRISGALKHVSIAADGSIWGVNRDDKIYRWNGSSWNQISGRLKQISVGNTATVWGVNADDEIYQWNGNSWTQVAGSLKHVAVASDGTVWGVNRDDNIYRRNPGAWDQVPGSLKQISVGASNLVWGVNKNDDIFRLR